MKKEIAEIARLAERFPIAGICLGHQLLGHALGGTTMKLKFGHHGINHPVKDLRAGRIYVTTQNHGFCVVPPAGVEARFVNLNDGTLEGFCHPQKPIMAVQHHPEAAAGPRDAQDFFQEFKDMIISHLSR